MSEVADIYDCTAYEGNRVRVQIIEKYEKASFDKYCDNTVNFSIPSKQFQLKKSKVWKEQLTLCFGKGAYLCKRHRAEY